jgi:putative transposase
MHVHLRRLEEVWLKHPVYLITTCTLNRRKCLADQTAHEVLRSEWIESAVRYKWQVGRYVIMPDHVHFFAAPVVNSDGAPLHVFVGSWKQWTAKTLKRQTGFSQALWQPRFHDHLIRSEISYSEKWSYIHENPVRAGLVGCAEDWAFQGSVHFL